MAAIELKGIVGKHLVDGNGEQIGRISDFYVDRQTGEPQWLAVSVGRLRKRSSLVPLSTAVGQGGTIQVPFAKDCVKEAPAVEVSGGVVAETGEARLYRHYGMT